VVNVRPPKLYHLPFSRSEVVGENTKSFKTQEDFVFEVGQYLTIRLPGISDPRGEVRQFSISLSPTETGEISITTTVEPEDSPFKNTLNSLKAGQLVEIRAPLGRFVVEPTESLNSSYSYQ